MRRLSRKMTYCIVGGGVVALVITIAVLYEPLKVRYLAHRVMCARNTEEEQEAFGLINRWTHGYYVRLYDVRGEEISPGTGYLRPEDCSRVAEVEIEWDGGYRIRKRLAQPGSFHERPLLAE